MQVVSAERLRKVYANGVTGLADLTVEIERGRIFGLLGPNGAGKSTAVRVLNGTLSPTSGRCRVLGLEGGDPEVRQRTATLSESARMYDALSAKENLLFFGDLYGVDRGTLQSRVVELLERFGLGGKADLKLGSYSTGMKKRVQLARTLLHRPELVFLDEPTSGLDPEASIRVIQLVRTLAEEEQTTVLLCTHNLPLAERVCDDFGFLDNGRMAFSGTRETVLAFPDGGRRVTISSVEAGSDQPDTEEFGYEEIDEINRIVRSVMDRGRSVVSVEQKRVSLEEAYFHYVRRDDVATGRDA